MIKQGHILNNLDAGVYFIHERIIRNHRIFSLSKFLFKEKIFCALHIQIICRLFPALQKNADMMSRFYYMIWFIDCHRNTSPDNYQPVVSGKR